MHDINSILNKLLEYYDIDTMAELSEILKVSQPTLSKWKARNTIIPIKRRCKELGIYNEIFGDLNSNIQIIDDIDNSTLSLFKEAYQKAKSNDDIKGFRIYLMDYK